MIWLVGGTSDSRQIAQLLDTAGIPWVATVTRPSATRLYGQLSGSVMVGSLTPEAGLLFVKQWGIGAVVDASHPFAVAASQMAMECVAQAGIPYLRFERPEVIEREDPVVEWIPTVEQLLQPHYLTSQRILSTLGLKLLPHLIPWLHSSQIWARVLPESAALALKMGFPAEYLLLERLPVDPDRERQLWLDLKLDCVLTKASGAAGGIPLKLALAKELGIRLLVLERPRLEYPLVTSDLHQVLSFCQDLG